MPSPSRWTLVATILGSSMTFIDATVVNVALPALQADLYATITDVQWVIEAYALFLGALLTAHFAPSPDVVRHFCTRALSHSAHAAELMLGYIDLQTRSAVPMLMSETDDQLHKLGSPLIHHYLLRLNEKRLDVSLLDVMVEALQDVGIDARNQLNQIRREEHSVTVRETNLLDYYYCSSVDQPLEAVWVSSLEDKRYQPVARYYKAYTPESRFVFVGEAEFPVQLCLTCRLPESQGSILVERIDLVAADSAHAVDVVGRVHGAEAPLHLFIHRTEQ